MSDFHDFLMSRFEKGGFSTEDALASFLPLARQVAQTHAAGKVAPLDGVAAIQVEGVAMWFSQALAKAPALRNDRIRALDKPPAGVEILSEHKRTIDLDRGGNEGVVNLQIGSRDQEVAKPVFLPGYICWEHQLGHHDPVSDVFCLGMILASVTCGLDFNEPQDLQTFVNNRRNLFRLNGGLHPVLAKAIVRMTELSRHARPKDLDTLIHNLAHYRDQNVDVDFDLASAEAAAAGGKKQVLLGKLQERLFEFSRRNRLLHFRSNMQAVNLTHASVPLSFDAASIRPEQILTWRGDFARAMSAAEPVSLNRYLNFTEQIYLPSLLDRVRSEALRDAAEFGFEQLRVAICFLRWSNVKLSPPEQFDSPLVLLPVRLVKKKGIRDSYWLAPISNEAELNPIVRHQFKQLYDIDLPAIIDLDETTLDAFYDDLAAKIAASEQGITLTKVDRPRIDLIHDLAKRRLDRYRRSARISGRGVRSFLDIDYSYDASNFHPLGLGIFKARLRPAATHLREIVQDKPEPRSYLIQPPDAGDTPTAQADRQFYSLTEEADDNPYNWDFDLCRLTLGNFRYRKMTLVRDYSELLEGQAANPAFDAVFSLAARPVELDNLQSPPLEERFHIVQCDPTQSLAIAQARAGASYIIQGPPGTGKSQTITNLIADYVMRGKKVLFVCEKRAAIDVVYARLRQQGLHQLCCLIHDSQTDKKAFILDLKARYEDMLGEQKTKPRAWQQRRVNLLKSLQQELQPLADFNASMLASHATAGLTVQQLLDRAIELAPHAPQLMAAQKEVLPDYAQWREHQEAIDHLAAAVADIQPQGVLARHPLVLLSPKVALNEAPVRLIDSSVSSAQKLLQSLTAALEEVSLAPEHGGTLAGLSRVLQYAKAVSYLAQRNLMGLLDETSPQARAFAAAGKRHAAAGAALAKAREAARHWKNKLPAEEVAIALDQARRLEGKLLSLLSGAWWRLRKVLQSRYDFAAHAVQPGWVQVLTGLEDEYKAAAALTAAEETLCDELGIDEPLEHLDSHLQQARTCVRQMPPAFQSLHAAMVKSDSAATTVVRLVETATLYEQLTQVCHQFLEGFENKPLDVLAAELAGIQQSQDRVADFLYCLTQLQHLPPRLAGALRTLELDSRGIEAAIVGRCVDEIFRSDRVLNRFSGKVRASHVQRLAVLNRKWQEVNAAAVLEKSRQSFLEHMRIAALPAAQLTAEQKEFKALYNRGRRELEHEFGKVMRHKSIRDIVAGDSGAVVGDLKPVWLMSPLSVSDTLPLQTDAFDVVIFDEASQITLEEAVPSIFRATQAIVVGDEMQLPPTDFFSAKSAAEDEEGLLLSDNGQVFEYDLSSNSFLNHAAKNLPARMLGWHYRSRSESLISFSNWAFYQGKLLTVPEECRSVGGGEIVVEAPQDGDANVTRLLDRPVSFHYIPGGTYDDRRNRSEADYIAHLVRGLLGDGGLSIGIVAFSEAQQTEIESALTRLGEEDKLFGERLEAEYEREVDGQYVGLLIKNLENIQGDERDVVIMSICYAKAPDGKMRMNFGPINQSGGEKRLNVAFSRAKHHMAVVSSIQHTAITNDYNDGANCLKTYLHYAAASSSGQSETAQRVLRELAVWKDVETPQEQVRSAVVEAVKAALTDTGYAVEAGIGMSHFRCDLAARRHGELHYRLGVLVDTQAHYEQDDLLERELLRPQLLKAFGWNIAHVLARDWYHDRQGVLDGLVKLIENGPPPEQDLASEVEENEDAWTEFDGPEEPQAEPVEEPPSPASPDQQGETPAPARPRPAPGDPVQMGPFTRYFEFVGGGSSKYWQIALKGNSVTVHYGRIGTNGQTQTKVFVDEPVAARTAASLIREKTGKGYQEKQVPA